MTEWEQEQDPAETYGGQGTTSTGRSDESKGAVDGQLPGTYTTSTDPPKTEPEDDDD